MVLDKKILLWRETSWKWEQAKRTLEGFKVTRSKFGQSNEIKNSLKKDGPIQFEAL